LFDGQDPLAAATQKILAAFTLTSGFWTALLITVPICVASAFQEVPATSTPQYVPYASSAPLPTPPLAIFVSVDTATEGLASTSPF